MTIDSPESVLVTTKVLVSNIYKSIADTIGYNTNIAILTSLVSVNFSLLGIFFGQLFGHFSGKNRVKFGHFANFSYIFLGKNVVPPKVD